MSGETIPAEFARAREQFLALVGEIRPELHRYCARLVGSAVQGEDIVQDTLAKAFYAISMATHVPALRPWLFRVAHNTAIDFLRRYDQRHVEARGDFEETAEEIEPVDPVATRVALSSFLELPVRQRCAVILKDVLGHSLEETADTMGTSVQAVKAALVRGRSALRSAKPRVVASKPSLEPAVQHRLEHYASLFNAHDWDGLRALVGEECRLDLVAKADRRGREVHEYFGRYAAAPPRLAVGGVEGRPALLVFTGDARQPSWFMLLEWERDRLATIRDYKYVDYIAADLDYALA
jgi:RNA polymerase sigma-70 factor (ECF subfamily)